MSDEYTDAEKLEILENPDDPRHAGLLDVLENSEPEESEDPAPYGYMTDPVTGERRPKKRPGRQRVIRPVEDPPTGERTAIKRESDRAPGRGNRKERREKRREEPVDVPPFRAGPIAKGMNGLYRKAGKIVRVLDPDVGTAIIACTVKESQDDVTVGEAWEELAKTNPRVRRFLLKLLTGGAITQLFMAHLPILLAILMKDGIRQRIPFMGFVGSFLDDEETGPADQSDGFGEGLEAMLGSLTPQDMEQMMGLASGLLGGMAGNIGRNDGLRAPTYEEIEVEDA